MTDRDTIDEAIAKLDELVTDLQSRKESSVEMFIDVDLMVSLRAEIERLRKIEAAAKNIVKLVRRDWYPQKDGDLQGAAYEITKSLTPDGGTNAT